MTMLGTVKEFIALWHTAEPSIKVFTLILAGGGLIGWIAAIIGFTPERRKNTKYLNTVWLIKK